MVTAETQDMEALAQSVDALGQSGLSQEEIAAKFGMTRTQLRYRLFLAGYIWRKQNRIERATAR